VQPLVGREETSFDESDAIAMTMTMLEFYETELRRSAEKGGPEAMP
jgi:hypothetical protein